MNQTNRTMTRRSRTVRTVAASLLLAALMTTAACGANSKKQNEGNSVDTTAGIQETVNGSGETGAIDTGTAAPDEANPDTPVSNDPSESTDSEAVTVPEQQQAEGTFNGLADSHSAEITTDEGTFVYQLDEKLEEQASALGENAKIRFEYTEKKLEDGGEAQRWLTKIEAE